MAQNFTVKVEGDELVIRAKLNKAGERSKSGKTLVVASSHGNYRSDELVNGKPVTIGFNAYVPLD